MAERLKRPRWRYANVLHVGADSRRLWRFAANGDVTLTRSETARLDQPLSREAGKDWRSLFQSQLNVAWLPAQQVFLRALQLPTNDPAEVVPMVELQLEKLSPLPVGQVVWTLEVMPGASAGNAVTVVVIIVPRQVVEGFLGQLEVQGYLADRLDLPLLDQLFATVVKGEGVWIYPGADSRSPMLVAWWYAGVLQNLSLVSASDTPEGARLLKDQIEQIAWAGELEGWLGSPPQWHLVADADRAARWLELLTPYADGEIEVTAPVPPAELAARTARRAVHSTAPVNLLPDDYSTRYKQQFIDRLWMRGLFAVLAAYTFGVLVYLAALQVLQFQNSRLQREVRSISQTYTNALQLEARIQVLEDRQNLKYAGLDCWKAVAETMPAGVTLDGMRFSGGRILELSGTVPQENEIQVTDFNDAMRRVTVNERALFTTVTTPTMRLQGPSFHWRFLCTLEGGEE